MPLLMIDSLNQTQTFCINSRYCYEFSQDHYVELTKYSMNVETVATTTPVPEAWIIKIPMGVSHQQFVCHYASVLQTSNEI